MEWKQTRFKDYVQIHTFLLPNSVIKCNGVEETKSRDNFFNTHYTPQVIESLNSKDYNALTLIDWDITLNFTRRETFYDYCFSHRDP